MMGKAAKQVSKLLSFCSKIAPGVRYGLVEQVEAW